MYLVKLFYSPSGRINRQTFLLAYAAIVGAQYAIYYAVTIYKLPEALGYLSFILSISPFLLAVKRWHDMDKSAWYLISLFIPFINIAAILELIIFAGDEAENQYGPPTNAT